MIGRYWRRSVFALAGLVLVFLLASCQQVTTPTPTPVTTPIPPIALTASGGGAKASGKIAPTQKVELGFPTAGRVQQVSVAVGQQVSAGDALVVLDQTAAEATVAQARAALTQTWAALAELQSDPQPATLAAAQAALDAAQARLDQLTEAATPAQLAAAQAEVTAAQIAQEQLSAGPTQTELIIAQATLSNTAVALQAAQVAYDEVAWRTDVPMLPESWQWQAATNNYTAAEAQYDALFTKPDASEAALATARVAQAQAALDQLLHPATESQIAEAEANVRAAQAELDLLSADIQAEKVAVAQAAVVEASAGLQHAEADLAATTLRAPFTGTITTLNVNAGQAVSPGQPLLTLADLSQLQVETTDLSERDVAQVQLGQTATIFVGPLGIELPGSVVQIAPQATVIGGDVVYTVVVALTEQADNLRWGMSVEVTIAGGQ